MNQLDYFSAYRSLELTRDAQGILVVEFHTDGGPLTFTAQDHTEFVDAFYRISQDRANKIVILTGTGGEFILGIDFSSFGNVADPSVWSQVHDEGVQILENLANIRVPVIAAIEGHANVHSEYALMANVIVAGEGATFNDLPHFASGIVPGDGIFTTWSYRAGVGRAEAFLLNPEPLTARTAYNWGVVAEIVPNGKALARARELALHYLKAPEVTRRNTRVHFIQPLKERIVREVGYGLSLEGASAADLVKSMLAKGQGLTEKDAQRFRLNTRSVDSEMGIAVGAQLHTDGYIGHARLVIEEDKHIIVGATFIGPQVSELLHSATVAIVSQIPIDRLWHAVPSFPTVSEVWIQLLENYDLSISQEPQEPLSYFSQDRSSSSIA